MPKNNEQITNTINEVSTIKLPNNGELHIKDATARTSINNLSKIFVDSQNYISIDYGGSNS